MKTNRKKFGVYIFERTMPDVEDVDPRTFLKEERIKSILPVYIKLFDWLFGDFAKQMYPQLRKEAEDNAEKIISEGENIPLPIPFYTLLDKDLRKKEQIKLLKDMSISAEQLGGLFLQAGKRGYKLSTYRIKKNKKSKYFLLVRILDNGIHWHCFYQTERGIKGKEPGDNGKKPHIHYWSDSFSLSKDSFLKKIKEENAPSSPLHIPLKDYQ